MATIQLRDSGLIEQRFKVGAELEQDGLLENFNARVELAKGEPYAVLLYLPSNMPLDIRAIDEDRVRTEIEEHGLKAVAVVVGDEMTHTKVTLYIKYIAMGIPAKAFEIEEDAAAWLKEYIP